MRSINHALTGAVLAFAFPQPLVIVPIAFASHYICDALPHYDADMEMNAWVDSKLFEKLLIIDALVCVLFVAVLAVLHPEHWLLASVSAFAATLPDAFWLPQFIATKRGKPWRAGLHSRFAIWIQWFHRPIGAVVEVAWAIAGLVLLMPFVK